MEKETLKKRKCVESEKETLKKRKCVELEDSSDKSGGTQCRPDTSIEPKKEGAVFAVVWTDCESNNLTVSLSNNYVKVMAEFETELEEHNKQIGQDHMENCCTCAEEIEFCYCDKRSCPKVHPGDDDYEECGGPPEFNPVKQEEFEKYKSQPHPFGESGQVIHLQECEDEFLSVVRVTVK